MGGENDDAPHLSILMELHPNPGSYTKHAGRQLCSLGIIQGELLIIWAVDFKSKGALNRDGTTWAALQPLPSTITRETRLLSSTERNEG